MQMTDVSVRQGLALVCAGLLAVLSWGLGSGPAARAYRRDRDELGRVSKQLVAIEAECQAAGGEAAWLLQHRERLAQTRGRFPRADSLPELLNLLASDVKREGLDLLNMSQGNLEPAASGDQAFEVDGQPCYRLPVTVTLEGSYRSLTAALVHLTRESFPVMVRLRAMELRLKEATSTAATLTITLGLNLYMTATSSGATAP